VAIAVLEALYAVFGEEYSSENYEDYKFGAVDYAADAIIPTGFWALANVLLVRAAFPPGRRRWIKYTLLTIPLITAAPSTVVLAWKAVTKQEWEPLARE
jgi:hypothetical protein